MSSPSPRRAAALARPVVAATLSLLCLVAISPDAASARVTPPSQPPSRAGATPECTIVGTPRADRLVGTARRDVICGRGGDDTLLGLGNDDVLLGGPGADTLDGGPGGDLLAGDGGRDRLDGGAGPDRVEGGGAADTALGGTGTDRVLGGVGNDDLTGGAHKDVVDGGPGTNWCSTDEADVTTRCVYDLAPPTADQLTFSTDTVDVTKASQQVGFRVHVTDDTGVDMVVIKPSDATPWLPGGSATLESGSVRNGWWEGTVTFHRWSRPGTFTPVLVLGDRIGRQTDLTVDQQHVDVLDETPDVTVPEATVISPGAHDDVIDVRTAGADLTVRLHITDDLSGVDAEAVNVALWAPRLNGQQTTGLGSMRRLESGTIRDGIWTARFEIPRRVVTGTWQLVLYVNDRASRGARPSRAIYWGPDEYPFQRWNSSREGRVLPFPDLQGSVRILGRERTDFTAPTGSGVTFSRSTIDTLGGPETIQVTARATDTGTGVKGVSLHLIEGDSTWPRPGSPSASFELVSGTTADGTWSGTVTFPQGYPPGTYYAWFTVWDRELNDVLYLSPAHPGVTGTTDVLDTVATVTVVASGGPP